MPVDVILAELEHNDDRLQRLLYVTPPADGAQTDADCDKSDDEHEANLDHLGRGLLGSLCEVQTACSENC